MGFSVLGKRKREDRTHPFLTGNFAPIDKTCLLTPCTYTGSIPPEVVGGEYIRNGSNPVTNEDLGREAHWFDGDGMLSGVAFKRGVREDDAVQPQFVNQYILTDVFLSAKSTPNLRKPILPSIATLVNPLASLFRICVCILRTIVLVLLSRLPGSQPMIRKISVANTSITYHDGRALATCESGPPLRISLPSLDTVGWFDGNRAEGEPLEEACESSTLGGEGLLSFMKEWTTAHPKVDPETNEMILFHSTFIAPYVHYSVIPATHQEPTRSSSRVRLLNKPVSGISSAKMMHDFGVSKDHTVIMDLPLTLDPFHLMKNKPPIMYDSSKPSRFGVFSRHHPSNVRWFETSACCIFHTANTWDVRDANGNLESVDMLSCRMTSALVVFSAGNLVAPQPTKDTTEAVVSSLREKEMPEDMRYESGPYIESEAPERIPLLRHNGYETTRTSSYANQSRAEEDEQCRLYYHAFSMDRASTSNIITHEFALSAIPFEFPSTRADCQMSLARYVYGCTTTAGAFNAALGRNSKIDALVKFNAQTLIARGKDNPPCPVTGCVDERSVLEILAGKVPPYAGHDSDPDPIQIFQTPPRHFAQEPRFVPSAEPGSSEDSGFLLTYVFNEAQLGRDGTAPPSAVSELWIIDAKNMMDVVAKVHLPQRVPYGLHGNWFPEQQILDQRPVERIRKLRPANSEETERQQKEERWINRMADRFRNGVINAMGG